MKMWLREKLLKIPYALDYAPKLLERLPCINPYSLQLSTQYFCDDERQASISGKRDSVHHSFVGSNRRPHVQRYLCLGTEPTASAAVSRYGYAGPVPQAPIMLSPDRTEQYRMAQEQTRTDGVFVDRARRKAIEAGVTVGGLVGIVVGLAGAAAGFVGPAGFACAVLLSAAGTGWLLGDIERAHYQRAHVLFSMLHALSVAHDGMQDKHRNSEGIQAGAQMAYGLLQGSDWALMQAAYEYEAELERHAIAVVDTGPQERAHGALFAVGHVFEMAA